MTGHAVQNISRRIQASLKKREQDDSFRSLTSASGIDFCSNDYLGLAREPLVISSTGAGSTGSRLISGHNQQVEDFEKYAAEFHGFERSLLFGSGYSANLGLLACLGKREDIVISDELIHASLIDGARLSYAERVRFAHNDLEDLQAKLESARPKTDGQVFVVVESIYSMDGDIAPLQEITALCRHHNAALIVDEAHAVGIFGPQGKGLIAELGLQDSVFAAIFTYGKAAGLHGAVVAGSEDLQRYLINYCRPFIYSTAPSPQTVSATRQAYDRFIAADAAREKLNSVLQYFESHLKNIGFSAARWMESTTPIQGLVIPGNKQAKDVAAKLQQAGFAVKAIVSPTVPEGQERLRISLHSFNTTDEMDRLAATLAEILN